MQYIGEYFIVLHCIVECACFIEYRKMQMNATKKLRQLFCIFVDKRNKHIFFRCIFEIHILLMFIQFVRILTQILYDMLFLMKKNNSQRNSALPNFLIISPCLFLHFELCPGHNSKSIRGINMKLCR
jgi:hypothetical protein